MIEEIDRS